MSLWFHRIGVGHTDRYQGVVQWTGTGLVWPLVLPVWCTAVWVWGLCISHTHYWSPTHQLYTYNWCSKNWGMQAICDSLYAGYEIRCCIAGKFGSNKCLVKVDGLRFWRWQINRLAKKLLIVTSNLDGFSLANCWWFAKFAKLSPTKHSCYTVMCCMISVGTNLPAMLI